ncbi:MAG: DUF1573 domain-containing protein [Anaerolineae bacterium]|nr:DUF1573 domain-containing protein [Anaerolineae bacterium]
MANKTSRGKRGVASPARRRPVALYLGLGALLLVVAGLALLWRPGSQGQAGTPAQAAEGPRLAVDKEEMDFGRVQVNKMVKATFRLTNAGNQPLQVLGEPQIEVKQGC